MKNLKFGLVACFALFLTFTAHANVLSPLKKLVPDKIGLGFEQITFSGKIRNRLEIYKGDKTLTSIVPSLGWQLYEKNRFYIDIEVGRLNFTVSSKAEVSFGSAGLRAQTSERIKGSYLDTSFNYKLNRYATLFTTVGAAYLKATAYGSIDAFYQDNNVSLINGNVSKRSWVPRLGYGIKFNAGKNWSFGAKQTYYWRDNENTVQSISAFVIYHF